MNTRMAANGYQVRALVDTIVTSPQFRNKRDAKTSRRHRDQPADQKPAPKRQKRSQSIDQAKKGE